MAIYVRLAQRFKEERGLHEFWMSMARHEAGHVGALELLQAMITNGDVSPPIPHTHEVAMEAAAAIATLEDRVTPEIDVKQAFEIAVELESTELEDLVLDLVHGLADREARDQAIQMIVHDLSDLSLMIEKYTHDDDLLARADALVQRHVNRRDEQD